MVFECVVICVWFMEWMMLIVDFVICVDSEVLDCDICVVVFIWIFILLFLMFLF